MFSGNGFSTVLSEWRHISSQSATELNNNINGHGSKINQYEALLFTADGFPHNNNSQEGKGAEIEKEAHKAAKI